MHFFNSASAFVAITPLRFSSHFHISTPLQVQTATKRPEFKAISFPNRLRVLPKCTQTVPPPQKPQSKSDAPYKRPSAKPQLIAEGDSLQSTPVQQLFLTAFVLASLATVAQVCSAISTPLDAISDLSAVFAAYNFTDFAVGVYHHAVDNYGSKHTPLVGYQIEAFQGHHKYPWTITSRDMPNNLYRLIKETHRQAHMIRPAPWVRTLQLAGIIVSPKAHAAHHRSSGAYEGNYCILSGWWNRALDRSGFFRYVEAVVYYLTGNEPICWRLDSTLKSEALRRLPPKWRKTL